MFSLLNFSTLCWKDIPSAYTLTKLTCLPGNGRLFSARKYLRQIVEGLLYLHKHQIIHRDLKLSNVVLTSHMNAVSTVFSCSIRHPPCGIWTCDDTPPLVLSVPEAVNIVLTSRKNAVSTA